MLAGAFPGTCSRLLIRLCVPESEAMDRKKKTEGRAAHCVRVHRPPRRALRRRSTPARRRLSLWWDKLLRRPGRLPDSRETLIARPLRQRRRSGLSSIRLLPCISIVAYFALSEIELGRLAAVPAGPHGARPPGSSAACRLLGTWSAVHVDVPTWVGTPRRGGRGVAIRGSPAHTRRLFRPPSAPCRRRPRRGLALADCFRPPPGSTSSLCVGSIAVIVQLFYRINTAFGTWRVLLSDGIRSWELRHPAFYGWLPLYLPELFPTAGPRHRPGLRLQLRTHPRRRRRPPRAGPHRLRPDGELRARLLDPRRHLPPRRPRHLARPETRGEALPE